jgi:uncharacterized SAM-binding protein YcdF (DUF218 family)
LARFIIASVVGLFLLSWPPAAWLASATLEARYRPASLPAAEAEAIVVLSGGANLARPETPYPTLKHGTYLRTRHAAWLHRNWRPRPVLLCVGAVPDFSPAMQEIIQGAGVPDSMIWFEDRSRSTYENAAFAARILREKGIRTVVLVTEAYHMYRAELCFRKQGLDVVPAPCAFRSTKWGLRVGELLPGSEAILENEDALHEWLGLAWYWVLGRI